MRPASHGHSTPDLSVVIPTYQRRDLVLGLLRSLDAQEFDGSHEVVMVVDGSTDGTVDRLREESFSFSLRILEQANRGLAATRNRGARHSRGKILLFLDDDMEAHPRVLAEHARSHTEGANVVLGSMPLHADSADTLLADGVGRWAARLRERLMTPGHQIGWDEIFGGHMSIRRAVFQELGGFDEAFTRQGSYGNEDLDFGYRVLERRLHVVFNPEAICFQHYVVGAAANLGQWRQVGRADVALARKHPEISARVFTRHHGDVLLDRMLHRSVSAAPVLFATVAKTVGRFAAARVEKGRRDRLTRQLFRAARRVTYWHGVHRAGGIPVPRAVRILCYHSLSDLADDPVLREYGLPREQFEAQLGQLRRAGYRFITPEEFARFLKGRAGLPRRPLLMTFDDAYADLAEVAPLLEAQGITAIVFVVSREVGGTNRWDSRIGARSLPLLAASGLRELVEQGHEIGAHSRSHQLLTRLSAQAVEEEVAGSVSDLQQLGFRRPRFFSYPHGEHNEQVRQAAWSAGVEAAFTVDPGRVSPGANAWALPRIEIFRRHRGWRLRLKIATAGLWQGYFARS